MKQLYNKTNNSSSRSSSRRKEEGEEKEKGTEKEKEGEEENEEEEKEAVEVDTGIIDYIISINQIRIHIDLCNHAKCIGHWNCNNHIIHKHLVKCAISDLTTDYTPHSSLFITKISSRRRSGSSGSRIYSFSFVSTSAKN